MMERTSSKTWIVIVVLVVAVVSMANLSFVTLASEIPQTSTGVQEQKRTLTVSGTGKLTVTPDEAQITVGVQSEAPTAKAAAAANAADMARVVDALKTVGVAESNMKTLTYSITPIYKHPQDGKPEVVAYRVTNTISVKTTQLEKVGEIVDAAVASGANIAGGIAFTVSDEAQRQLRTAGLELAVSDAAAKATQLAEDLGVRIVGVQTVTLSEGGIPMPFPARMGAMEAGVQTPILPGESEFTVTVQVTYIISS